MKNLITYFIKYPVAANILILLIMILGFMGVQQTNSTLMPQIDPGRINITAAYPGASPEEIEQGVVLKIEDNLRGLDGIYKITSVSKENSASVTVEIETGYDSDFLLQEVKNAVDGINSFPSGMEPVRVSKRQFRSNAMWFSITGDVPLKTLKKYARLAEDELRELDGVSKISLQGFPDEEIQIAFRENDLRRYDLTFDEAYNAVRNANIDLTGGIIRGEDEELYIRTKQKQYYAKDLEDIILRSSENGAIIRLSDIATVSDQWVEQPSRTYINGNPAVVIQIDHTSTEDIIHISEVVNKYIGEFNEKHSEVTAKLLYDLSSEISVMMDILVDNGIAGFVLVLLFLSLFLNRRLSFWVAFSLPLSFMGMFVMASMYGLTINRITLFGMIMVIGILVDDGIVICESIYQHYEKGKQPIQAAIDGTMEVLPAVFSAVLTTIIAFSTFFMIEGIFGQFFENMAFVIIGVLIFSLIEGALILPSHVAHSKALKGDDKQYKWEIMFNKLIVGLRDKYYAGLLRRALRNKWITMVIPTGLFLITMSSIIGGVIRQGDSSIEDSDNTDIVLEMPAGTPENETWVHVQKIEAAIYKAAEEFQPQVIEGVDCIKNLQINIGPANYAKITTYVPKADEREFHSMDFSNRVRELVGSIPEAQRLNFVQTSHFGKPVSISLKSYDLEEITAANNQLKEELGKMKGLKNILDDSETGMREIKVTLKNKAYVLGLSLQDVMNQVRQGFYGKEVQRINRGRDEVKIWVRYQKEDRAEIGDLENMRIRTNTGNSIPLKNIANLEFERNLVSINHLNGRRRVKVEADLVSADVNLTVINKEINDKILPAILDKYPGVSIAHGGHEEEMSKATDSMFVIVPVILVLLLAIVTFTFRSFLQTAMVFMMIPLGIIGVGWGHFIHGIALDMPSYLGMVALIGIMINDSIVLISTYNNRLREGKKVFEAAYEAALSRFRPIILTSLTTVVGLGPLILTDSPEADIVIPMAISVAYGLVIATLTTLLILPVMLIIQNRMKVKFKSIFSKTEVIPEEQEQAIKELKEIHI